MFSGVSRPQGLRFDVVGQVLMAIFRGELKCGDRLIVQRMAADFGVSATPAREALLELAGFGVLDLLPNKGAVVRQFGPQQLQEIYYVRSLLETEATRLACGRISQSSLDDVWQQALELVDDPTPADWPQRAIRCDRELHTLIAESSGIERLVTEIDRYSKLVQVARGLLGDARSDQQQALTEHLEIMKYLREGKRQLAAEAMNNHIRNACNALIVNLYPNVSLQWPESRECET